MSGEACPRKAARIQSAPRPYARVADNSKASRTPTRAIGLNISAARGDPSLIGAISPVAASQRRRSHAAKLRRNAEAQAPIQDPVREPPKGLAEAV